MVSKSKFLTAVKWAVRIGLYAIAAAIIAATVVIIKFASDLPDYRALAVFEPPVATRLFASDGSLLIEYAEERRVFIPFEDMPPMLVNAFTSAEDQNFWWHPGIDVIGIIRATKNNTIRFFGGPARFSGASTITQQVAKNFFLTSEQTIARKVEEAILAMRLERAFSKEHIMTLYLNQIFLGARSYGVGSAALMYFDTPVHELSLSQMAFLAALPRAPSHRHVAVGRRQYVLRRMVEDGHITRQQADEALAEEIVFSRGFIERMDPAFQFFAEEVRRDLLAQFGREKLYNDGLYVKTTIDPRLQRAAAESLQAVLRQYNRGRTTHRLQGAIIVINPHTGRVLAMTGGYCFRESSFNRATQARRQVGSTIKPFLFLAALETGRFTPQTLILDAPVVGWMEGGRMWKPENSDRRFLGPVPFRLSLEASRNIPAIRLVEDIGIRRAINAAERFGVYTAGRRELNMSMALGSGETTLANLTLGFAAFVNGGHRLNLRFVDYVQDRHGRNIDIGYGVPTRAQQNLEWYDGMLPPPRAELGEPLADPRHLYQITSILQGAVEHVGSTGRQARVQGQTVAGKTGTTNEVRDIWFVGYSKDLAVGVWMGYDTPRPMARGFGSFTAAGAFGNFMREALYGQPNRPFPIPDGMEFIRVNRATGVAASIDPHGTIVNEAFIIGQRPNDPVQRDEHGTATDITVGGVF